MIFGEVKKKSKLGFGTIGNEFAASDLPPEGQKKRVCRKRQFEKKILMYFGTTKFESGASDFPPEGPKKGCL